MYRLTTAIVFIVLAGAFSAAQQPATTSQQEPSSSQRSQQAFSSSSDSNASGSYKVNLRCEGFQTAQQARAVKSDALGFGNPTSPEADEKTELGAKRSRTVLVEISGNTGRMNLPPQFAATSNPGHSDGWWPISTVRVTAGDIYFEFNARSPGPQVVRINRISGQAELRDYGPKPLHAACRVDQIRTAF